jgi:hypothetical protein
MCADTIPHYPSLAEIQEAHKKARIMGTVVYELFCPNCKDYFWDIGRPLKYGTGYLCELCYLGIIS